MNCEFCNDTGSLSKEAWGHLDCTRCDAAIERVKLEVWAKKCGLDTYDTAGLWTIYQHGKQAGATEVARTGA
jgi:hypothetical protein